MVFEVNYNQLYYDRKFINKFKSREKLLAKYIDLYNGIFKYLPSKESKKHILDLGCGYGNLARFLSMKGYSRQSYTGIDFSSLGIQLARKWVPKFVFARGDLLDKKTAKKFYRPDYVYVILEVLEHVKEDLRVLSIIPLNSEIILSVPNFSGTSHVRFFETEKQAINRYSSLIDVESSETIKISINDEVKKFFIIKGRRI